MEIVKVDINELTSPEYNPRQITDDELKKLQTSLEGFGYLLTMIVAQALFKTVYENIIYPVTRHVITYVRSLPE